MGEICAVVLVGVPGGITAAHDELGSWYREEGCGQVVVIKLKSVSPVLLHG